MDLEHKVNELEKLIKELRNELTTKRPNTVIEGTTAQDIAMWLSLRPDLLQALEDRIAIFKDIWPVANKYNPTATAHDVAKRCLYNVDDYEEFFGKHEFIQSVIRKQWQHCELIHNWDDDEHVHGELDKGWDLFKQAALEVIATRDRNVTLERDLERAIIYKSMNL